MFSSLIAVLPLLAGGALASPLMQLKRWEYQQYFDLQGHRGGRGEDIEK